MADWVSMREVARRRGCTHGAVQKAITTGRIPEAAVKRVDGRIDAIDYELATAHWNASTDVDQAARTSGGAATASAGAGELPLEAAAGSEKPGAKGAHELRVASAEGKQLQNRLLELELLEEMGHLVSRDEVRVIAVRRYRAIRDQILAVPDRVADILAAERDPARVHAELTKELERVLHELSDAAVAESAGLVASEAAERVAA